MRILHTSDWHLGQYFYGKSRAAEHQAFLTWLLMTIEQEHIDVLIVAGDIFDTGTPPSYAREMYFDFVVALNKLTCQLVMVAGNHDSVAMLGESKNVLKSLNARIVPAVCKGLDEQLSEQVFTLNDKNGEAIGVICAIPFIRPRDVLTSQAGQSAQEKQLQLQQAISDHYQHLFQHAQSLSENNLPIIATGHLTTVGVTVTDSVREIYIGTLDAFPASAFPEADYIALGHIHRSQKVAKSEHIRYSGSPIALSFDEAKQPKSVLIAEFEQQNLKTVTPVTIPCFQPMLMVKTHLDSLFTDVSDAIAQLNLALVEQKKSAQEVTDEKLIWLDIEIQSSEYLTDLQSRIEQVIETLPVEVLLVRRAKTSREKMTQSQEKISLDELNISDVFQQRLSQENWPDEQGEQRQQRLSTLFAQMSSEFEQERQS